MLLGALVLLSGCGATGPARLVHVPIGEWGGDHIRLTVTNVNAIAEFDCAQGTLDQPLLLDRDGRFDVTGTFVRGHGGPIRLGEVPDSHPARYLGTTAGHAMSLTVTVTDKPQDIGTFSLRLDAPPLIVKCL